MLVASEKLPDSSPGVPRRPEWWCERRLDAAPPCRAERLGRSWQDGHLRVTGQTLAQRRLGDGGGMMIGRIGWK